MAETSNRRLSPEQLLRQVEAEERYHARGKLKIFLGYASGVGKSFRMLDEGRRRKGRGQDVVVAAAQPSASPEVAEVLRNLEVIPPRMVGGGPVMDLEAVLRRHPLVCLIDGLAYDNPPGSKHPQRWQDVEELLAAGISVITSINVQYVLELQPRVEAIRGKKVKESVPEAFLRTADEIELVDAPPEYCVPLQAGGEMEQQLSELRELALVLAAEVVDHQLEDYLRRAGIEQVYETHERILICVTPRSNAALMIQRGRKQADLFHGDLHVVYVQQEGLSAADQSVLDENLACARAAKAHVEVLRGEDPVESILRYARVHGITQLFLGHSQRKTWLGRWRVNPVERLIMEADGMDVRIFPHSGRPHAGRGDHGDK